VLDLDGKVYRVQVKYCDRLSSRSSGSILVDLASYGSGRQLSAGYDGCEVDTVVVYLPSVNALCWFDPADYEGKSTLTLRLTPPKNRQRHGIRLYSDYVWS
ncbi:MAG: group I intron-associated PD-(D/E)XK endonuclease, partial [Bacteroidota bacterium]